MTDLAGLISNYGWQAVTMGVLLWVLLRSDIRIHYPGKNKNADE